MDRWREQNLLAPGVSVCVCRQTDRQTERGKLAAVALLFLSHLAHTYYVDRDQRKNENESHRYRDLGTGFFFFFFFFFFFLFLKVNGCLFLPPQPTKVQLAEEREMQLLLLGIAIDATPFWGSNFQVTNLLPL